MSINEKIEYWLDIASYDLDTAKSMLRAKRLLYVGFMCHQVVEKALKGYHWFSVKEDPPYIHNLSILAKKAGIYEDFSNEQRDLIDFIEPLNIRARYPRDKEELFNALSRKKAKQIIKDTEGIFKWIKQLMKK